MATPRLRVVWCISYHYIKAAADQVFKQTHPFMVRDTDQRCVGTGCCP